MQSPREKSYLKAMQFYYSMYHEALDWKVTNLFFYAKDVVQLLAYFVQYTHHILTIICQI